MDLALKGKNVVVVGGSSNIGRAISLAFAREGAGVAVVARHVDDCQKVADVAMNQGASRAIAIGADVTKLLDVERMIQETLREFNKIDVLVISMGWNTLGYFTDIDPKWWGKIIDTNYINVLNCFKVVLPLMTNQKSGNIVTITSVIGRKGDPTESVYGGLKAAEILFSRCIAQQAASDRVRINCVAPGLTVPVGPETLGGDSVWKGTFTPEQQEELIKEAEELIPLGKVAKPTDVAYAVLFLASDVTAGHITGTVLGVDGGLYMGW